MTPDLQSLAKELSDAVMRYNSTSGAAKAVHRKQIFSLANDIKAELEEPFERIDDYMASLTELPVLRLLMDWDVFAEIPPGSKGITYARLAANVGSDESLVRRLWWLLVARGLLRQVGGHTVIHMKFSLIFRAKDGHAQWFKYSYDSRGFIFREWPKFFAIYGPKEPGNTTRNTPGGFVHGRPDKSYFECLPDEKTLEFMAGMRILSSLFPPVGVFPLRWIVENVNLVANEAALVVDVGGSQGEALQQMRDECPDITAEQMVLQDRPPVIEQVQQLYPPALRGVKKMAHDFFFSPQPVKGALAYFIKRELHDWSNDQCRVILKHLHEAMGPESRILIHESVLTNPPRTKTSVNDLAMLNLGGKERAEEDWKALLDSVGLAVVGIWRNEEAADVAAIECRRRS